MRILRCLAEAIDNFNDRSGKIFSFLIYGIIFLIGYEVISRYVFNHPTFWAHETSQYFFGAHFMLAGAYTLRHHEHVNVDMIYNRFSPRIRAVIDVCTSLFFFLFCGLLFWNGLQMATESFLTHERSASLWGPPVYPAKLTIPLGAVLILLQGFSKLIRDMVFAVSGRKLT